MFFATRERNKIGIPHEKKNIFKRQSLMKHDHS